MPEQKPVPSRRMSNILTYVRVELMATTDVQSLLEIPGQLSMVFPELSRTMVYKTR